MSEINPTETIKEQQVTTPPATEPSKTDGPSFWGISIGTLATGLFSVISSVAGASPYGVIAVAVISALASLAGVLGYNYLINEWNKKTDKNDMNNSGADAGKTAVDLSDQITQINKGLDGMQQANPPVPPSQQKTQ
jgi:hypothetical protein